MLNVATEKVHSIFRIDVDAPRTNWKDFLKDKYVPFLFLEKDKQMYAYVETGDLKRDISFEELLDRAVSLEMVGVLEDSESISLPFIFTTFPLSLTNISKLVRQSFFSTKPLIKENLLLNFIRFRSLADKKDLVTAST